MGHATPTEGEGLPSVTQAESSHTTDTYQDGGMLWGRLLMAAISYIIIINIIIMIIMELIYTQFLS
jgi:hypothetical protein